MTSVERLAANQARALTERGDAWLVCAYDDHAKCERNRLEGAITLDELRARTADGANAGATLIFY